MIPDHPVIHNMELTGHPDGIEPPAPRCPICGSECEKVYARMPKLTEYVGCDNCLAPLEAYEEQICFEGEL